MKASRNSLLAIVLVLGAYAGSFHVLPRSWSGNSWPGSGREQPLGNLIYNVFYYPLRWATQRTMRQDNVTVYRVDLEKREVLVIFIESPFAMPYRGIEDGKMHELRPGDRIRARTEAIPDIVYGNWQHVTLRDYERLPTPVAGQMPGP